MNIATPCRVQHRRILDADGKWLGEAYRHDATDEPVALATLWAAAPELLAALKRVEAEVVDDDPDMWRQVAEAIAKAEGA